MEQKNISGIPGTPQKLDITKMLTVSTAHIHYETMDKILEDGTKNDLGLAVYKKSAPSGENYGVFLYLSPGAAYGETNENMPEELAALIKFARDNGCGILCLDSDGMELEGYPTFEW